MGSSILLQKMYGQFASPDFPNVYPNNKERIWDISIPKGYTIRLYFTYFNLELSYLCEYDYVKVCGVSRVSRVLRSMLHRALCLSMSVDGCM